MTHSRLKSSSTAALLVALLGCVSVAHLALDAANAAAATTGGRGGPTGGNAGAPGGNPGSTGGGTSSGPSGPAASGGAGPSGPSGGSSNGRAGGANALTTNVDCVRDRCTPPRRPRFIVQPVAEAPMHEVCHTPGRLVYNVWGEPFYVYCNARSQRPYYSE